MIDLSPIQNYIIIDKDSLGFGEDIFNYDNAIRFIEKYGFDSWIDKQIHNWCNCTLICNGHRINQTNDKRYNRELTLAVKMIEEYGKEDKDKYYEMLLKQHNANLEFEAINGFEYDPYSTTKKKFTTSKKKTKQTSLDFGDKPKKETAAERKLKAHAAKISILTFKIKPANNDNTL